jgi:glycerol-3-phosphate dehydrogenase subunit B
MRAEVVVVGAGPAGLASATRLGEAGRDVLLLARGNGFTHWGAGAVDVLGRAAGEPVQRPLEAIGRLPDGHPYRLVGDAAVRDGLDWFGAFTTAAGLAHAGDPEHNRLQVTAFGTLRPTCLLPTPAAGPEPGGQRLQGRVAVVGFAGFRDFSPALCALGLRRAGIDAGPASAPLPAWDHDRYFTGVELARAIDDPGFRRRLAPGLARAAAGAEVAVVPAVLGLAGGHEPWADLQGLVGVPLLEAATAPPSIPGLRLFAAYRARLNALGVRWQFGFPAVGVERDGDRVTAVYSEGASRPLATRCQELVLATGGVAGNGIEANRDGTLTEQVAGLPVEGPVTGDGQASGRLAFLDDRFLGEHPLGAAGVRVDAELRPLDGAGEPLLANVRCVGGLLAGHDPTVEGSREGVALATAARVAALPAATPAR